MLRILFLNVLFLVVRVARLALFKLILRPEIKNKKITWADLTTTLESNVHEGDCGTKSQVLPRQNFVRSRKVNIFMHFFGFLVDQPLGSYFLQNDVQLWCPHLLLEGASVTSPTFEWHYSRMFHKQINKLPRCVRDVKKTRNHIAM